MCSSDLHSPEELAVDAGEEVGKNFCRLDLGGIGSCRVGFGKDGDFTDEELHVVGVEEFEADNAETAGHVGAVAGSGAKIDRICNPAVSAYLVALILCRDGVFSLEDDKIVKSGEIGSFCRIVEAAEHQAHIGRTAEKLVAHGDGL